MLLQIPTIDCELVLDQAYLSSFEFRRETEELFLYTTILERPVIYLRDGRKPYERLLAIFGLNNLPPTSKNTLPIVRKYGSTLIRTVLDGCDFWFNTSYIVAIEFQYFSNLLVIFTCLRDRPSLLLPDGRALYEKLLAVFDVDITNNLYWTHNE